MGRAVGGGDRDLAGELRPLPWHDAARFEQAYRPRIRAGIGEITRFRRFGKVSKCVNATISELVVVHTMLARPL